MRSKTLVLRKTLVARALYVAFGTVALTAGMNPAALAQSNVTGTIFGKVDAAPGTSIVITSKETGARRTITPDSTGSFNAQSVNTGTYKVDLVVNGRVTKSQDNIEVRLSQGSEVSFATALQTVQILGLRQKIDVSSMGSTTIFTASDLAKVPVASNVGAVIQLAPNTTRGDTRYGGANAPSFGGSSASENAYYINGFPVTTLLTQVGFSQLPFNSISQAQVLTGGYGPEFGRSTGGVVNIVTKSGGNEWVAGGALSWEPNNLRATQRNRYYEKVGYPTTGVGGASLDGKIMVYHEKDRRRQASASAYIGGPIIKDKLFMFLSAEQTELYTSGIRSANGSANPEIPVAATTQSTRWQERETITPRYLLKLDWNLSDMHHLEYTRISDVVNRTDKFFGFDYSTLQRTNVQNGGSGYVNWGPTPTAAAAQGAVVDIIKYTGYLTDDLTLTALVGRTHTPHEQSAVGYVPGNPQISTNSAVEVPGLGPYPNAQGAAGTLLVPGAFDKNVGARLDVEYKLNSKHNLRAGIDRNKISSKAGTKTAGGVLWTYGKTDPAVPVDTRAVATNTVLGNPNAQAGYLVTSSVTASETTPTVEQSAWYIEDRWKVTDRLLLSLGLRNEGFDNKNGDGKTYVNLSTQLAPRIGASWDVMGDSSLKVFGNLGRYHVPLPTNVAVRGAGSSLFVQQHFVYTGVDPVTGAPTGLTAISPLFSNNNEFGQAKDPREVAAQDLKGNYQDELAFGFEKAVSKDLNVGAKFTYRTLRTVIDDHCDDRPFYEWAARNSVTVRADWLAGTDGYHCALFNPGLDNTFNIDIDGDGNLNKIKLSAADLGFASPKRKYVALDLFAEHPFDGKWWGKATYTYARNTGNTEGQLLSDIGQGDVSTTQAFDFPEFGVNADGPLPNDRKHQIKLFGYYQVNPEWGVGANFLYASGRPKNCIGIAPVMNSPLQAPLTGPYPFGYSGYGSAYFFCNGVPSPRGSLGTLPADYRMDLNVAYKPRFLKGFTMKLDVFNFFNRQSVEVVEERYNAGGTTNIRANAGTGWSSVQSYTAPRSMKITASYDHKF